MWFWAVCGRLGVLLVFDPCVCVKVCRVCVVRIRRLASLVNGDIT